MENIKMSHVSVQRILAVASRVDELSTYETNTLKHLFKQCSKEEQQHMVKRFGEKLDFLSQPGESVK